MGVASRLPAATPFLLLPSRPSRALCCCHSLLAPTPLPLAALGSTFLELDASAIVNRITMKASDASVAGGSSMHTERTHDVVQVGDALFCCSCLRHLLASPIASTLALDRARSRAGAESGFSEQSFNTMFTSAREQMARALLK